MTDTRNQAYYLPAVQSMVMSAVLQRNQWCMLLESGLIPDWFYFCLESKSESNMESEFESEIFNLELKSLIFTLIPFLSKNTTTKLPFWAITVRVTCMHNSSLKSDSDSNSKYTNPAYQQSNSAVMGTIFPTRVPANLLPAGTRVGKMVPMTALLDCW